MVAFPHMKKYEPVNSMIASLVYLDENGDLVISVVAEPLTSKKTDGDPTEFAKNMKLKGHDPAKTIVVMGTRYVDDLRMDTKLLSILTVASPSYEFIKKTHEYGNLHTHIGEVLKGAGELWNVND